MRPKGSKNRRKNTGVFVTIPAAFDIEQYPELTGLADSAHAFLSLIIRGLAWRRREPRDGAWTHVSWDTFEELVHPSRVGKIKKVLLKRGVIHCDERYRISVRGVQGYSQRYALTPRFAKALRTVQIGSQSLAAKIEQQRPCKGVSSNSSSPHEVYLRRHLCSVEIYVPQAMVALDAMPEDDQAIETELIGSYRARNRINFARLGSKAVSQMAVEALARRELDFKICPYGRVHTNITRLPTSLRPALRLENQTLVNLDIRNSQLVFLLLLLIDEQRRNPCKGANPLPNTLRATIYSADVELFKSEVLDGVIYDNLMTRTGHVHRGVFKQYFFRDVLFGNNKRAYSRNSLINRAFTERYPSVAEFIRLQKLSSYADLARNMQRRESDFVIKTVCGRLAREFPDLPVLTIHDSFLTPAQHASTVHAVMMEEFEQLGVQPVIRQDLCESPQACPVAA